MFEAAADLERVVALTGRTPYYLGVLGHCYGRSGRRADALRRVEKAYDDGALLFNYLAPSIRDLYALDPHHKKRLQQMHLIL